MFLNTLKTWILLSAIAALMVFAGRLVGGNSGALIAFFFALFFNFATYFYSDKIVLKMYGAKPLDDKKYSEIFDIVQELSYKANIPMPKLWLMENSMANAFATGRNPSNASVAFTTGILDLLNKDELRGVIAHELSHVINRDILVGTIAATFVAAIAYLADMLRWRMIFGGFGGRDDRNPIGVLASLLAIFIVPLAATLLQLSISRTREYMADESGAKLSYSPLSLASALEKIEAHSKGHSVKPEGYAQEATASLFISNPFRKKGKEFFSNLFSTHPPIKDRVEKLRNMDV